MKAKQILIFLFLVVFMGTLMFFSFSQGVNDCYNDCNYHYQKQFKDNCEKQYEPTDYSIDIEKWNDLFKK